MNRKALLTRKAYHLTRHKIFLEAERVTEAEAELKLADEFDNKLKGIK